MTVQVGQRAEFVNVVGIEDTAEALVSGTVHMLSTPRLVAWVEAAAVMATQQHLEPGMTSVGTHIDLRHKAPSPVGAEVTAVAEVTRFDGRRIDFVVAATSAGTEIGTGTHRRVVVEAATFGS